MNSRIPSHLSEEKIHSQTLLKQTFLHRKAWIEFRFFIIMYDGMINEVILKHMNVWKASRYEDMNDHPAVQLKPVRLQYNSRYFSFNFPHHIKVIKTFTISQSEIKLKVPLVSRSPLPVLWQQHPWQGGYTNKGCHLCVHCKTSAYDPHDCTQCLQLPRGTQSLHPECRRDCSDSRTHGSWWEARNKEKCYFVGQIEN